VCVGAKEKVRSVCLVTKGEDLKSVKSVALDVSSKTSVALTKIIFREFLTREPDYKEAKPNLETMLAAADCALLIGDPALTIDEKIYRKFDLAETWKNFTNFGFVFAMWMANAEKSQVAGQINFSRIRDEGLNHLDEIIANYAAEIPLPVGDFKTYLSKNIAYAIDDSMRAGLSLYFELAHKHQLIERLKPLQFLD
jgi:chorismate dehydratase